MIYTATGAILSSIIAFLITNAGAAVDFNVAAVGALLVAAVSAYTSARLLRANRSRIVSEAASHATDALDRALKRYESDNGKLTERVKHLEQVEAELRDLLIACGIARDEALAQVEDLNRRLRTFEERTAMLVARLPAAARHGLLEARLLGADPADPAAPPNLD